MQAIEFTVPMVGHRIDFRSDELPANVAQARIQVMYEPRDWREAKPDIVAFRRAARASFPKGTALNPSGAGVAE